MKSQDGEFNGVQNSSTVYLCTWLVCKWKSHQAKLVNHGCMFSTTRSAYFYLPSFEFPALEAAWLLYFHIIHFIFSQFLICDFVRKSNGLLYVQITKAMKISVEQSRHWCSESSEKCERRRKEMLKEITKGYVFWSFTRYKKEVQTPEEIELSDRVCWHLYWKKRCNSVCRGKWLPKDSQQKQDWDRYCRQLL